MKIYKKLSPIFPLLLSLSLLANPAYAAAPDGAGPWADTVLSSSQGLMKNGSPVPAVRSNPNSALGVAEDNTVEGNFFSLGFGGKIALGFNNGISSGVIVVEATNPNYPAEKAKVEVSENGITWVNAGEVTADGSVNKPAGVTCAKYVRITDISNPNDFSDATADAYDVDGVKATGEPCKPEHGGGGGSGSGDCTTDINQTNKTQISLGITSNSSTGNNKTNNNTGGSNKIKTGDATTNTTVGIVAGSNIVKGTGCCCGGDTNVNISGNGAGSTNTANINSSPKKAKKSK